MGTQRHHGSIAVSPQTDRSCWEEDLLISSRAIIGTLAEAGFLAPEEEAQALQGAANRGAGPIDRLLERRLDGEPLAWIVGTAEFCDRRIHIVPGVFVPRPHTEWLARRAAALLPDDGRAVDLCTGNGAVAAVIGDAHPLAEVLATDIDPVAVACGDRNGVHVLLGDLDAPLPRSWLGSVDVMTAVPPYVPTDELHLLPRDVVAYEPRRALDGGDRGTRSLSRAVEAAARWLRPGGTVLLELGGDQAIELTEALRRGGLSGIRIHRDPDGHDRAIEASRPDNL